MRQALKLLPNDRSTGNIRHYKPCKAGFQKTSLYCRGSPGLSCQTRDRCSVLPWQPATEREWMLQSPFTPTVLRPHHPSTHTEKKHGLCLIFSYEFSFFLSLPSFLKSSIIRSQAEKRVFSEDDRCSKK